MYQEDLWGEGKPSEARTDWKSAAAGLAGDAEVGLSNCVQRGTSWLASCRHEGWVSKDIMTVEPGQVQQAASITALW